MADPAVLPRVMKALPTTHTRAITWPDPRNRSRTTVRTEAMRCWVRPAYERCLAGWDLIRAEILKLVRRVRRGRLQDVALRATQQRQKLLRPRYDKLLAAQSPKWKLFVPVFDEFLLFESVRPLWDCQSDPTDTDWLAAQSLVVEELEGWRLEIVAHASAATFAAASASETTSRPSELDFEQGGKLDLLEASWLVSHFVSCAYKDCRRAVRWLGWRRQEGSDVFIGSLHDVLQHQQLAHNSTTCLDKTRSKVGCNAEVHLAAPPVCGLHIKR